MAKHAHTWNLAADRCLYAELNEIHDVDENDFEDKIRSDDSLFKLTEVVGYSAKA